MWDSEVAASLTNRSRPRRRPRPRFGSAATASPQVHDVRTSICNPWQHHEAFENEDDDDDENDYDERWLTGQPLVCLNIIHVADNVIVVHLDDINLLGVAFDHSFTSNVSDDS
jgi:hypothetical protein